MKKPNDYSEEFQKVINEWRKRHHIRDDDAILLCIELFRMHQKHWDEMRHRDLPSFTEFRETILKLKMLASFVQRDASALLEELRRQRGGRRLAASSLAGLVLTAIFAAVTGMFIGKFLL